ncbi:MAG: response regulator [Acidobacteria bacterium]|nr:MAG: response regulator [Acidobacteriota bacterium]PIE90720.1 MAG: response regulator [Acidobacteriota bacterium]
MSKILIIDDDRDIVENLEMILEANGYDVAIKWDTDHLVEDVSRVNPDLIILDIMFPEDPQAGFNAARTLHKTKPLSKIPVILLSAVNQRSNMSFGFSDSDISDDFMPVKSFIEKPVEPAVLLEKIKDLL